MNNATFEHWLAGLFGTSVSAVEEILGDRTAVQFLTAWSLFESRCFSGFVKVADIRFFAERLTGREGFDVSPILEHVSHFHTRYKTPRLYENLIHGQLNEELAAILRIPAETLTPTQALFFATFVVYRFRNNIFHGNKGVSSWLQFTEQIDRCVLVMMQLISHAEVIESQIKGV